MSTHPQQLNFDQIEQTLRIAVDPCERKHKGADTSVEAHNRIKHTKEAMWTAIMDFAERVGSVTVHEVAREFGKTPNEVSGRLSELRLNLKWLTRSGERRGNAHALIVTEKGRRREVTKCSTSLETE